MMAIRLLVWYWVCMVVITLTSSVTLTLRFANAHDVDDINRASESMRASIASTSRRELWTNVAAYVLFWPVLFPCRLKNLIDLLNHI